MLDKLRSLLHESPPAMAFEITEAGIAAARIGSRAELDYLPLRPGTLAVSPLKENVLDPDEFVSAVRSLAGTQAARKRRDVALILPDFSARISVLDFDAFPYDPKQQLPLVRFRLKKSLPFDIDAAAISYYPQANGQVYGGGEKTENARTSAKSSLKSDVIAPSRSGFSSSGSNIKANRASRRRDRRRSSCRPIPRRFLL